MCRFTKRGGTRGIGLSSQAMFRDDPAYSDVHIVLSYLHTFRCIDFTKRDGTRGIGLNGQAISDLRLLITDYNFRHNQTIPYHKPPTE